MDKNTNPNHSELYTRIIDEQSPEWLATKAKRMAIDDCCCVHCGRPISQTRRGAFAIHHIKYGEDLMDLTTIITLCGCCHGIIEGYLEPWDNQYDPRTEQAQKRLSEYIQKANAYIKGETTINEGWFMDRKPSERSSPID